MKSAISPDIWETKRSLITKLYKDEEWPLKQVIKLVQTHDFHPSESQLRSRLKKWHITKPSRKKYDGSRRLSGAKKNAQKRPSESQAVPSSSTFHTLQSQPRPLPSRKAEESDYSDGQSETSRASVSVHEMSTSPSNRYILPSSPIQEEHHTFTNMMAPSTPITPAVYGMEESKRASNAGQSIYFFPPDFNAAEYAASHPVPVSYSSHFGSFSAPSPMVDHRPDYMAYSGVHYLPSQSFSDQNKDHSDQFVMSDLPPPLLDGSWEYQPPSPTSVFPQQSYFLEEYLQPLAPPIYPAM
ncbi:hypothetical protein BJY04DRAFT_219322 [Aspergillus karnatakaensis]|uniref:Clr5 domain-containing protein n=1 Tax=Aspergillus karnatakaensis TaxID=1810916 RepID=UPI003CCD7039